MPWHEIHAIVPAAHAEELADQLTAEAADAVTLSAGDDEECFEINPNEQRLWQHTKISALFPISFDINATLKSIHQFAPNIEWQTRIVEDQDWVRMGQMHFKPQCFADRLWVVPSWEDHNPENIQANEPTNKQAKILLDPGLAFGTGTHPTTRLCLSWLAENIKDSPSVIDYGCGSGILACAAHALICLHGKPNIIAIDHDEQAGIATKQNRELNKIPEQELLFYLPEQEPKCNADIVVANILAQPLRQLADHLIKLTKPGGDLVLSGLLANEAQSVYACYQKAFELVETKTDDGWGLLWLRRN